MKTLREYIDEADKNGKAIGHFNISNLETLHGIYEAAKELNLPVIIGLSEGEEDFVGEEEAFAIVESLREKDNHPIFLNADHHYSFESVRDSLDAGYDSAIIDGVKLSLEENIKLTKKCVEYAREHEKITGKSILIEAELGFIGTSSKLLEELPEGVNEDTMTRPEDAKRFVEETGVDLLAASVGNVHGMVKGGNPKLDIERIKKIRESAGVPLVLHGGSGVSDDDFKKAIKAGVAIVHINTEIRVAYKEALEKSLSENKDEIAPYKYSKPAVEAVKEVVKNRLQLFNSQ